MTGRFPGPCPACEKPIHSYHLLCDRCSTLDDRHTFTPDGKVVQHPYGFSYSELQEARKRREKRTEGEQPRQSGTRLFVYSEQPPRKG